MKQPLQIHFISQTHFPFFLWDHGGALCKKSFFRIHLIRRPILLHNLCWQADVVVATSVGSGAQDWRKGYPRDLFDNWDKVETKGRNLSCFEVAPGRKKVDAVFLSALSTPWLWSAEKNRKVCTQMTSSCYWSTRGAGNVFVYLCFCLCVCALQVLVA